MRRLPPNLFGIAFGLAGLAGAWRVADEQGLGVPGWPAVVLYVAAAAVWLLVLVAWARQFRYRSLAAELGDLVFGPFVALVPVVAILLGTALYGYGIGWGRVIVVVSTAVAVALAAWLTAGWMTDRVPLDAVHPGYLLPSTTAPFVGGAGLAGAGWPGLAMAVLGIGLVQYLFVGVVVRARLVVGAPLPPALLPTLAIEMAPSAVAGNAYFVITGGRVDALTLVLAGTALLMVLVQVRLAGGYRGLVFGIGFWSFSFSYATVCAYALRWLEVGDVPDRAAVVWLVLGAITAFIGWLAVRTVLALRAGTFLPPLPPPAVVNVGQGGGDL